MVLGPSPSDAWYSANVAGIGLYGGGVVGTVGLLPANKPDKPPKLLSDGIAPEFGPEGTHWPWVSLQTVPGGGPLPGSNLLKFGDGVATGSTGDIEPPIVGEPGYAPIVGPIDPLPGYTYGAGSLGLAAPITCPVKPPE